MAEEFVKYVKEMYCGEEEDGEFMKSGFIKKFNL